MVGGIFLTFIAFCGQRIDNLLLCYLTSKIELFEKLKNIILFFFNLALIVCLIPGARNRQLIPLIRQYITDFWSHKRSVSSCETNKRKTQ